MDIIIHGLGRLGLAITRLASEGLVDGTLNQVVSAVDTKGSAVSPQANFPIYSSLDNFWQHFKRYPEEGGYNADVIIDCSRASAVADVVGVAAKVCLPLVICTTGLCDDVLTKIKEASKRIPIFLSGNMSLGVNVVSKIAADAAKTLAKAGFDIEIIESHHNQKIDAPSGTAFMLANKINETMGAKYNFVTDRSQKTEKRDKNEIGISSIRGGTIVGEHTVIFAGPDEVIEITHKAASREIFARGALVAAAFINGKPAGLYNMDDLLADS